MKKIIMYIGIFIGVFILLLLFGMFVAGNDNVLEWDPFGRFVLSFFTIVFTGLAIAVNEDK